MEKGHFISNSNRYINPIQHSAEFYEDCLIKYNCTAERNGGNYNSDSNNLEETLIKLKNQLENHNFDRPDLIQLLIRVFNVGLNQTNTNNNIQLAFDLLYRFPRDNLLVDAFDSCSRGIEQKILKMKLLARNLRNQGDFSCQRSMLKVMVKLCNTYQEVDLTELWFKHGMVKNLFQRLRSDLLIFPVRVRVFLNIFNKVHGEKATVVSFSAKSIFLGNYELGYLPGELCNWVDFNKKNDNISIICPSVTCASNDETQTLTLVPCHFDTCSLYVEESQFKTFYIFRMNSTHSLSNFISGLPIENGNEVVITFRKHRFLPNAIRAFFPQTIMPTDMMNETVNSQESELSVTVPESISDVASESHRQSVIENDTRASPSEDSNPHQSDRCDTPIPSGKTYCRRSVKSSISTTEVVYGPQRQKTENSGRSSHKKCSEPIELVYTTNYSGKHSSVGTSEANVRAFSQSEESTISPVVSSDEESAPPSRRSRIGDSAKKKVSVAETGVFVRPLSPFYGESKRFKAFAFYKQNDDRVSQTKILPARVNSPSVDSENASTVYDVYGETWCNRSVDGSGTPTEILNTISKSISSQISDNKRLSSEDVKKTVSSIEGMGEPPVTEAPPNYPESPELADLKSIFPQQTSIKDLAIPGKEPDLSQKFPVSSQPESASKVPDVIEASLQSNLKLNSDTLGAKKHSQFRDGKELLNQYASNPPVLQSQASTVLMSREGSVCAEEIYESLSPNVQDEDASLGQKSIFDAARGEHLEESASVRGSPKSHSQDDFRLSSNNSKTQIPPTVSEPGSADETFDRPTRKSLEGPVDNTRNHDLTNTPESIGYLDNDLKVPRPSRNEELRPAIRSPASANTEKAQGLIARKRQVKKPISYVVEDIVKHDLQFGLFVTPPAKKSTKKTHAVDIPAEAPKLTKKKPAKPSPLVPKKKKSSKGNPRLIFPDDDFAVRGTSRNVPVKSGKKRKINYISTELTSDDEVNLGAKQTSFQKTPLTRKRHVETNKIYKTHSKEKEMVDYLLKQTDMTLIKDMSNRKFFKNITPGIRYSDTIIKGIKFGVKNIDSKATRKKQVGESRINRPRPKKIPGDPYNLPSDSDVENVTVDFYRLSYKSWRESVRKNPQRNEVLKKRQPLDNEINVDLRPISKPSDQRLRTGKGTANQKKSISASDENENPKREAKKIAKSSVEKRERPPENKRVELLSPTRTKFNETFEELIRTPPGYRAEDDPLENILIVDEENVPVLDLSDDEDNAPDPTESHPPKSSHAGQGHFEEFRLKMEAFPREHLKKVDFVHNKLKERVLSALNVAKEESRTVIISVDAQARQGTIYQRNLIKNGLDRVEAIYSGALYDETYFKETMVAINEEYKRSVESLKKDFCSEMEKMFP